MKAKPVPVEAVLDLRQRRLSLPPHSTEGRKAVKDMANLYGVSEVSIYRALRLYGKPHSTQRKDQGVPRVMSRDEMEEYCELIAAIKVRTNNRKKRCLPTTGAIQLLEDYGIETPNGLVRAPPGKLRLSTVNKYLKAWGYDREALSRQPAAVRFQAQQSNECWQFDLSPSDLKHIQRPPWSREGAGAPTLMLYSIVDDRSGAAYQEYHCVYGEDVEAGLRFLFNAMAAKESNDFPNGIPEMIYTDNGPIARSQIFHRVMGYLGVEIRTHLPAGKDGRRVTARSKGKVERPFRTVKELHETLYHFHAPETEEEANTWLRQYLSQYNHREHRSEPHSRIDDWLQNLPKSGVRAMCEWDQYCHFAREPEKRKVGSDTRITINGIGYETAPELAGETVVIWWGLYDEEIFVEFQGKKYGPYYPAGGPIPLHKFRAHKKTALDKRADRIEQLARVLSLPEEAYRQSDLPDTFATARESPHSTLPFLHPDPFQVRDYANPIEARKAIADHIGQPLARLGPKQLEGIAAILEQTLDKEEVIQLVTVLLAESHKEVNDHA